jgi:hypothetical protein
LAKFLTLNEQEQLRDLQTRTLPMPLEVIFPKVLAIMIDQGYLLHSIDKLNGMITFSQQWRETGPQPANITIRGTIFLSALEPAKTRLRVMLTGNSRALRTGVTCNGQAYDTGLGSVQQHADPAVYREFLDFLEMELVRR